MRPIIIIITLLWVMLSSWKFSEEEKHCQSSFQFLVMEAQNSFCWIGQTQYGSCQVSEVIQLGFEGDQVRSSVVSSATFDDWAWTMRLSRDIPQDYAVELDPSNDFAYPLAGLKVRPPSYNASLYDKFMTEMYGHCGVDWNDIYELRGIELPKIVSDKPASLVYCHPEGLYFNYEIEEAIYFPDSRYLLLFTQQKQRCGHNAPMNGFLIFRLG